MKAAEYTEGHEAKGKFEQAMKTLFQASKRPSKKKQAKKQPATLRKKSKPDKG